MRKLIKSQSHLIVALCLIACFAFQIFSTNLSINNSSSSADVMQYREVITDADDGAGGTGDYEAGSFTEVVYSELGVDKPPKFELFKPGTWFDWFAFVISAPFVAIAKVTDSMFKTTGTAYSKAADLSYYGVHFSNKVLFYLQYLIDRLGKLMLAVGIVLALGEEAIRITNGGKASVNVLSNIIKATLFSLFFTSVEVSLFKITLDLGSNVMNAVRNIAASEMAWGHGVNVGLSIVMVKAVKVCFSLFGQAPVLWIIILGALAGIGICGFTLARRGAIFLALMAKGAIYPMLIARGNSGAQSYITDMFSFYLGVFVQAFFYTAGLMFVISGHIIKIIFGVVLLFSVNEVPQWVGSIRGENDFAKALHSVSNMKQLLSGTNPTSLIAPTIPTFTGASV